MTTDEQLSRLTENLRKPARVGAAVAAVLRQGIIDGDFQDGDLLPKEDELLASFRVSRQSVRDAMRILETEGLVTVRRGNAGGAVVHAPRPDFAAYMFSLVLANRGTTCADLALALESLEPTCAAMCAEREDRAEAVVPILARHLQELADTLNEQEQFTIVGRNFHQALVDLCGSDTLALIIGTLETLWSAQAARWAGQVASESRYPSMEHRHEVLEAHKRIIAAIDKGDPEKARSISRRHLRAAQQYVLSSQGNNLIASLDLSRDGRSAAGGRARQPLGRVP